MHDIEKWGSGEAVASQAYWEEYFPGHGAKIVAIIGPFRGWKPDFGPADEDLVENIKTASRWRGQVEVRIVEECRGPELVGNINEVLVKVLQTTCNERHRARGVRHSWTECNESVGNAFGPVIGDPGDPETFLRSYLYELLIQAIECILADNEDMLGQLELILKRWFVGNYLLGFDANEERQIAYVFVADAP